MFVWYEDIASHVSDIVVISMYGLNESHYSLKGIDVPECYVGGNFRPVDDFHTY
jgi:hypothetical protein